MSMQSNVILLAEDDPNDVFFMQRALDKAGVNLPVRVARNGQEAIDYLSGSGKFSDSAGFTLPQLLLLDMKMPFVDGFEVLEWVRSQPALKELPVIILTSSSEDRDRQRAAELGAKAYFVKPPTREMVLQILGFLERVSA